MDRRAIWFRYVCGGRPIRLPFARALRIPVVTRSTIKLDRHSHHFLPFCRSSLERTLSVTPVLRCLYTCRTLGVTQVVALSVLLLGVERPVHIVTANVIIFSGGRPLISFQKSLTAQRGDRHCLASSSGCLWFSLLP